MRDPVMERPTFARRHDFDRLPRSAEIDVQRARHSELSTLADMANRLVPGVQIAEPDLERYFMFDPQSILTFSRKRKLLGAVAFLYLNGRGHDALVVDSMNPQIPTSDCSPVAPIRYRPFTCGQLLAKAGRWLDWVMCQRIFLKHDLRRRTSMLDPQVPTAAI